MTEVIAFIAGVLVCRAFLGPIPRRAMDDIRMSAVALNHLSETTRRMLTAMQGIERQLEKANSTADIVLVKASTPKMLGK